MGFWDKVKAALGRESAEAKDIYRQAHDRLSSDLDRREAELAETPEEKLARMTKDLETAPDPFDEVRARLDELRDDAGVDDPPPSAQP